MAKPAYRSNSLSEAEQIMLIDVAETFEDVVLFKLALCTGIRREDIVRVERANLDIEGRKLKFWEAKKKRVWTIPLPESIIPDLTRFLNTSPNQKLLFSMSGRTAYRHLQKYIKKAGITKHIAFHDLRRTFVKTAKKRGLSPQAVAQITGDSLSTIDLYYSNLDMGELKLEVNKL